MNARLIASLTGGFTLAILAACSVETTGTPGSSTTSSTSSSSGGGTPISTDSCKTRCSTKLTACEAPAGQIDQGCSTLCDGTITEEQATCFEGKDCEAISKADTIGSLCPKTSTSSSSGGSSSGGSSSGSTSSGDLPDSLTIKGTIPSSTKANHVLDDDKDPVEIVSLVSVAVPPTVSPELPAGVNPNVADDGVTFTINEPSPGDCVVNAGFTYNSSQIGVTISGTDKGTNADCAKLTDDIAKGRFKATLKNVPYVGGLGAAKKATVIIDLN